jgi:hypothetical protein
MTKHSIPTGNHEFATDPAYHTPNSKTEANKDDKQHARYRVVAFCQPFLSLRWVNLSYHFTNPFACSKVK